MSNADSLARIVTLLIGAHSRQHGRLLFTHWRRETLATTAQRRLQESDLASIDGQESAEMAKETVVYSFKQYQQQPLPTQPGRYRQSIGSSIPPPKSSLPCYDCSKEQHWSLLAAEF